MLDKNIWTLAVEAVSPLVYLFTACCFLTPIIYHAAKALLKPASWANANGKYVQ